LIFLGLPGPLFFLAGGAGFGSSGAGLWDPSGFSSSGRHARQRKTLYGVEVKWLDSRSPIGLLNVLSGRKRGRCLLSMLAATDNLTGLYLASIRSQLLISRDRIWMNCSMVEYLSFDDNLLETWSVRDFLSVW